MEEARLQILMQSAGEKYPTMKFFHQVGWMSPVRSTFRYSLKQTKVLYEYFIEGEKMVKRTQVDGKTYKKQLY